MANTIADLLTRLQPDEWRHTKGFSQEIEAANQLLFDEDSSAKTLEKVINDWIQKYQPCIFGKLAAARQWISYCILTEADLNQSDLSIREKIQSARSEWKSKGITGRQSGFVILAISRQIANAVPDDTVKALAKRLSSLYLLEDIHENVIYTDSIRFEAGEEKRTWEWRVGVNYFCAQGDGRWWQDHRIPGGMAFSMNSAGHMVKVANYQHLLRQAATILNDNSSSELNARLKALGIETFGDLVSIPEYDEATTKIDSLEQALIFAMKTIGKASEAVSGRATNLLPLPEDISHLPQCPVALPQDLADKNYCEYTGHYDTDYTLPSEYFRADVERPVDMVTHALDFTYLFDNNIDNPDSLTMGEGIRVREDAVSEEQDTTGISSLRIKEKRERVAGKLVYETD